MSIDETNNPQETYPGTSPFASQPGTTGGPPLYPGTSPFAGQPGTTGGPPLPEDWTPPPISETIPAIPEVTSVGSIPTEDEVPSGSVHSSSIFTKYWGQLRGAANDTWKAIRYYQDRETTPGPSGYVGVISSEYENQEEYDRWATAVQEQQEADREAGRNMRAIPTLINEWTTATGDHIKDMLNQTRAQWAKQQVENLGRMAAEAKESFNTYRQNMIEFTAPIRWQRLIEEGNILKIPAVPGLAAPEVWLFEYEVKEFIRDLGWNEEAQALLQERVDRIKEEKPVEWPYSGTGQPSEMTDEQWATMQRTRMNHIQEALFQMKRDMVDRRFSPDAPEEWGSPEIHAALDSIGDMDWLDAHPEINFSDNETVNHLINGTGLNVLDHIIDTVDDTDPVTGAPNFWTGVQDILEGNAVRDAHENQNFFNPDAIQTRDITNTVIGLAFRKYTGKFTGADVSDLNAEQFATGVIEAGRYVNELASQVLNPDSIQGFFKDMSSWTLPHLFTYLSEKTNTELERLRNDPSVDPDFLGEFEQNTEYYEQRLEEAAKTIDAQTEEKLIAQKRIERAQRKQDYYEQQRNNPEYVRLRYFVNRIKAEGIEDPTGRNWEEFDDDLGTQNTWAEATRIVLNQAIDGELGFFTDGNVMKAYKTSLEIGEMISESAPKAPTDGANATVRKLSIENTNPRSPNDQLAWSMISGNRSVEDGYSPDNPRAVPVSPLNVQNITNMYGGLLDTYNTYLTESLSPEMAERVRVGALPGGFTLERALTGKWGVDARELNVAELYAWSRTLQAYSSSNPTPDVPVAMSRVGDILAERLNYLDGKDPDGNPITPRQKALALGAARTVASLKRESNPKARGTADFFKNVPNHIQNLMDAIANRVDANLAKSMITWDMAGLTMDELIVRFNAGEGAEISITDTETGAVLSGNEAINMMFEEYNKGIDLMGQALYNYEQSRDQFSVDKFTGYQRAARNVTELFRSGDYRLHLKSGEEQKKTAVFSKLNATNVSMTNYGDDTIDLTPEGTEGKQETDEGQRLQQIIRTHPLLSPSFEEGETIDPREAEARILRVLSTNSQAGSMLEALMYSQATAGENMGTLDLIETTLNLLGATNLRMIRTGPNDTDTQIMQVPSLMRGELWDLTSNAYDPETGEESLDDRTRWTSVFRYRGPFMPVTNRNEAAWNQYQKPHLERSGEIARSVVADTLGLEEDDPRIAQAINEIIAEDKARWDNSYIQVFDKFELSEIQSWQGFEGVTSKAGAMRRMEEYRRHQQSEDLQERWTQMWDNLPDEFKEAHRQAYDFQFLSIQDVILGALDRTSNKITKDRATDYPKLHLLLTKAGLGGDGLQYRNARFRLGSGSILSDVETGTISSPRLGMIMEIADQVTGGPPSEYSFNLSGEQINDVLSAGIINTKSDNAVEEMVGNAEGIGLGLWWHNLWNGEIRDWEIPEAINDNSDFASDVEEIKKLAEASKEEGMSDEEIKKRVDEAILILRAKSRYAGSLKEELAADRQLLVQALKFHRDRGDAPSVWLEQQKAIRKAQQQGPRHWSQTWHP